jgi:hypothetical protein
MWLWKIADKFRDARHPFSGFLSLATAVNELNCAPPAGAKIDVEYATSSLGRMSKRFRAQLWFALEGQYHSHGIIPTYERRDHTFRIRFPSAQSASSAPNCIRRLDLFSLEVSPGSEEEKFLDATLVDNPPKALLSHAKVLRVTWQIGSVVRTYMCLTSANLSPTAWGSSWECGVLVAGQRTKAVDIGDSSVRYRCRDKWT